MIKDALEIISKTKKLVYYLFSNELQIVSLIPSMPIELGAIQSSDAHDLSDIQLIGPDKIQQLVRKYINMDFMPLFDTITPACIRFIPAFFFRNEINLQHIFKGLDNFYMNEAELLIQDNYELKDVQAYLYYVRNFSELQVRNKINLGYAIHPTQTAAWSVKASELARKTLVKESRFRHLKPELIDRFEQRIVLQSLQDPLSVYQIGTRQMGMHSKHMPTVDNVSDLQKRDLLKNNNSLSQQIQHEDEGIMMWKNMEAE